MVCMELSKNASLIFNNNGSIVVRRAYQSRDGVFHDIVVTDGARQFRKEDWTGCEKILLNKIWAVYSQCITEIQSHPDLPKKIAPEQVRFVYNKNPATANPDKIKLFINSANSPLPPIKYAIGHLGKMSEELGILSTILLQPHAKSLPPKPAPTDPSKTSKSSNKSSKPPKKTEPTEPEKPVKTPEKPATLPNPGVVETPPEPRVKLPPVRQSSVIAEPEGKPPKPVKAPAIKLAPVRRPRDDAVAENQKQVRKEHLNAGSRVLGSLFHRRPLEEQLL